MSSISLPCNEHENWFQPDNDVKCFSRQRALAVLLNMSRSDGLIQQPAINTASAYCSTVEPGPRGAMRMRVRVAVAALSLLFFSAPAIPLGKRRELPSLRSTNGESEGPLVSQFVHNLKSFLSADVSRFGSAINSPFPHILGEANEDIGIAESSIRAYYFHRQNGRRSRYGRRRCRRTTCIRCSFQRYRSCHFGWNRRFNGRRYSRYGRGFCYYDRLRRRVCHRYRCCAGRRRRRRYKCRYRRKRRKI